MGLGLAIFGRKVPPSARLLFLPWTAFALAPTAAALEPFQEALQEVLPPSADSVLLSTTSTAAEGEAIGLSVELTAYVTTEAELKAAVKVDGSTIVLTQNITLTSAVGISSAAITVSSSDTLFFLSLRRGNLPNLLCACRSTGKKPTASTAAKKIGASTSPARQPQSQSTALP